MTTSLIISTYNSPEALRASLRSVLVQRELPDEVIVADDGSGGATAEVVEAFRAQSPVPVKHVWHPDDGFRLAAIRNKAIAHASGDYILQADGDILFHRDFVADHKRLARPGHFMCGSRVLIGRERTERILAGGDAEIKPWSSDISNRKNAVRSGFLGALMGMLNASKLKYRGCNMAFWRSDLVAVNGYDESYVGWGCEDHDLVARLINGGILPLQARHRALCYHLWHPSAKTDDSFRRNNEMLEATRRDGHVRSRDGLDKYLNSPAVSSSNSKQS